MVTLVREHNQEPPHVGLPGHRSRCKGIGAGLEGKTLDKAQSAIRELRGKRNLSAIRKGVHVNAGVDAVVQLRPRCDFIRKDQSAPRSAQTHTGECLKPKKVKSLGTWELRQTVLDTLGSGTSDGRSLVCFDVHQTLE